jgi:NCAIR mutase (PurE)-related protein
MGNQAETVFDVGVAGIHRLFKHKEMIESAAVLIVVAGMEGALPSVVAGMVSRPLQFECRRSQYRQRLWCRVHCVNYK